MPWKPPAQPTCARCDKIVYPVDKLDCLDKVWHKACFSCEVCQLKLTMNTYKGFEKLPYCKTHYPHGKATAVAETPESMRLKKQTERQSAVAYHKAYEETKGQVTSVASNPEMDRVAKNQKLIGTSYDQRDQGAAAAQEEESAPPPRKVIPAAQPEPEAEPEPEPEPEAEPEPEQPKKSGGGGGGARYKVVYDYEAADQDELTIVEGDFIIDAEVIDDGWMRGVCERTGQAGMLPSNYVEPA